MSSIDLASIPSLADHGDWMSEEERRLAQLLIDAGQAPIFDNWEVGKDTEHKHVLFKQVAKLDSTYPGGIKAYVRRAKDLLSKSARGENPFDEYKPEVPEGVSLKFGSKEFNEAEQEGMKVFKDCAFVLVAGGLGERLGYNGIKISLPTQLATEMSYLDLYIRQISRFQEGSNELNGTSTKAPLAIMTSDDTHSQTIELLEKNDYYSIPRDQVTLMKQDKVPALTDNEAHFALDDPFTIATKPHGHGDVHVLLNSTGLAAKWLQEGRKYVIFFQDTNSLAFLVTPPALGVSQRMGLEVNSITIPRKAGEAVGAITKLVKDNGESITCNVEYNQLAPLLRATTGKGDENDQTGYSPYPGNINQLIMELSSYVKVIQRTGGLVPEFVNPKYADETKTKFTKPTRLECMMQDHPRLLGPDAKVGFTNFDAWTYSPVKNSLAEGAKKAAAGVPPRTALEGELEFYDANARVLRLLGCDVEPDTQIRVKGFTFPRPPMIVVDPRLGCTPLSLQNRFPSPSDVRISNRSALVLEGGDIVVESLDLDGALEIVASPGCRVIVRKLRVHNSGWDFEPVDDDEEVPQYLSIRGCRLKKDSTKSYRFDKPGEYVIEE